MVRHAEWRGKWRNRGMGNGECAYPPYSSARARTRVQSEAVFIHIHLCIHVPRIARLPSAKCAAVAGRRKREGVPRPREAKRSDQGPRPEEEAPMRCRQQSPAVATSAIVVGVGFAFGRVRRDRGDGTGTTVAPVREEPGSLAGRRGTTVLVVLDASTCKRLKQDAPVHIYELSFVARVRVWHSRVQPALCHRVRARAGRKSLVTVTETAPRPRHPRTTNRITPGAHAGILTQFSSPLHRVSITPHTNES